MFSKSAGMDGVSIIMVNSPNRFYNINPRLAVSQAFGVNWDLNSTSLFLKEKASLRTAFEIK